MLKPNRLMPIIFCSVVAIASFFAKAEVKVAVGIIPGLIEKSLPPDNAYMDFINRLAPVEFEFLPMSRADKMFVTRRVDCIFPASTSFIPNPELYLQSQPVNTVEAFIFYRSELPENPSLDGKVIAIRRGLNFGDFIDKHNAEFVEFNSDILVLQALYLGRIDAIVAYLPDLIAAQQKAGIRQFPNYDASAPIYRTVDALVCRKNVETTKIVELANQLLEKSHN